MVYEFHGRWQFLVLVFAAKPSEMALRSIFFIQVQNDGLSVFNMEKKMAKLFIYMSKSKKVKMNYSRCHVY